MSWFDEQIKTRIRSDNEIFEDSFLRAARVVLGKHLSAEINDKRQITKDAIGEILKYYHVRSRQVPDSITDIDDVLEFLLRPYGIMRRNVTLEKDWYKDATGPMLGTKKEDGSIIALIPDGLNGYSFFDAAANSRIKVNRKTESMISKEAITFYKPFPTKKIGLTGLIRYMAESITGADIICILAGLLSVTLIGMLIPKFNNILFSKIAVSDSIQALTAISVFMVCVTVSWKLLEMVKDLLMKRLSIRLGVQVEAASMMRILSLPSGFFKKYSSGELANRVQMITILVDQLINILLSTSLTSVFSLLYMTQLFSYAPKLAVTALIVILSTLAVSIISAYIQIKITSRRLKQSAIESGISYSLISSMDKIRLSGAEKRAFAYWGRAYTKAAELLYDPPMFLKMNTVLTTAITLTGTVIMYFMAVKSGVSVPEYYAFNTAYGMVSGAFVSLSGITLMSAQIKPIMDLIKPIFETQPEVDEDKQVIERLSGNIELNNVTFSYDKNMPNVLEDINLKIHSGEYVAIAGKTGCGKSTLMKLLLGMEKPQKGAIYYDKKDLENIDLKSLRRKIGTVMQNGKLFTGDIYSNIVMTAPRLTIDDAWEAAELAGIADDIRDMPMGMFSFISEGNGGISGGQRQRLLIARAIAPKPKILMFDEATSALDNITQKIVSDSLDKLKCTRIVIAHRLSTIQNCDRIIVLDKGHIIEDGTYDELIAQKGFFADLVRRQRINEKNEKQ